MNKQYSFVANSGVMFFICGLAILVVLVQAAIFFRASWKEAIRIGFTKADLLKVVKSSTVFSIVPSLPIIISYMILLPALGKYFPWLRLSVIGSATYGTMAANMAVTSYGFSSLGSADFSPDVFGSIMWVVTLGVFLSSMSALVLKKYDKKMQSITTNKKSFGALVPNIMFLGMMATLAAPYLVDVKNVVSLHHSGVCCGHGTNGQDVKAMEAAKGICVFNQYDIRYGNGLSGDKSDQIGGTQI